MKVMEIYDACQGEGVNIGQPSTFIRTFGCNMRCSWCDTAYSINPLEWSRSPFREGPPYVEFDAAELLSKTTQVAVVLTGGEPTIQPDVVDFIHLAAFQGKLVTIETNGTLLPAGLHRIAHEELFNILWSISPKLISAGEGGRVWNDPYVVDTFLISNRCQLKFVIQSPFDLLAAVDFLRALKNLNTGTTPVVLQPEGSLRELGAERYLGELRKLQDLVCSDPFWKRIDVRILPQLHTLIHGRKRFV